MSDLAPERDTSGADPALTPALRPLRWSRVGPVAVIASLVLAFALAGPRLWHSVRSDPTAAVAVDVLPPATQSALGSQLALEQAPTPQAGQVAVLGRFTARDPFAAPASAKAATAAAPAPAPPPPAVNPPVAAARVPSATPEAAPATGPQGAAATALAATPPLATATTALPASDPAASTVTLSVNGVAEPVAVKGLFPAADPIFRLAALGATSVQIAVAGAGAAPGDQTVPLSPGRSLTLLDTASGARYALRLVATPASPAAPAAAPVVAAAASTLP